MEKNKFINKISSLLFYTGIITFFIAFGFAHNPKGAWTPQFMPFLNNRPLADIIFLDSLTGYAVTGANSASTDTNFIIKTTNSGETWIIIFSHIYDFNRIQFLNNDTGYVNNSSEIFRTTNSGKDWIPVSVPPGFGIYDMFAISYDTIWLTFPYLQGDYIYRSTNAGQTWTNQLIGNGFKKIYFFNNRIGFIGSTTTNVLLKTTNSGLNWTQIPGDGFIEMYFTDSLTGWKAKGFMKKTTDGGETWINQPLPSGGNIIVSSMESFTNINNDTIWGGGGGYVRLGSTFRGILYRTTNKGELWEYQIPDTSFRISNYDFVNFYNKFIGWAYKKNSRGIYTTTGGDTSFITSINSFYDFIPEKFTLHQNYPNPFNPITRIIYELDISSLVKVEIFDLLGKEIGELINEKHNAGKYEIEFDGSALSSGIYFYSLIIENKIIDTKKMLLIR